jgi:hypothetical protein
MVPKAGCTSSWATLGGKGAEVVPPSCLLFDYL